MPVYFQPVSIEKNTESYCLRKSCKSKTETPQYRSIRAFHCFLVEVAGLEPASERKSTGISTSVVCRYNLAVRHAANEAPNRQPLKFPPCLKGIWLGVACRG